MTTFRRVDVLPWPVRRQRHRIARVHVIVAGCALACAATVDIVNTATRRKFDLKVYIGSVQAWVDGGALYDYVRPGTRYGFTYPPFAAHLMSPMAWLPWRIILVVQACLTAASAAVALSWLLAPLARRHGWPLWAAVCAGLGGLAALAPVRDVIGYGQINLLLLGLVAADLGWLAVRGHRWAGAGIGIATAIKLVPGLFVVYLVLVGRLRTAAVATGTFLMVTAAAAVAAPADSADYWLHRCWQVRRVGDLASTYNQSLRGGMIRVGLDSPRLWVAACLAVLGIWAWRVLRLPRGADRAGLALTGVTACLISPVTWVHHLVWVVPALVVAVDAGAWRLALTAGAVLASRITWLDGGPWIVEVLAANGYLLACLVLLVALPCGTPVRQPHAAAPDLADPPDDGCIHRRRVPA